MTIPRLHDGPAGAPIEVVLAHGAGAPMDSPFLAAFATAWAQAGLRVTRFEFPYMQKRREDARRRPPDPPARLMERFREVARSSGDRGRRLILAGKSMGARYAAAVAPEVGALGALALGYPFHPVGRLDRWRLEPLLAARVPVGIVQGERDPFGSRNELAEVSLPANVELHWIAGAGHSFEPRPARGADPAVPWRSALEASLAFLRRLAARTDGRAQGSGEAS